MNKTTQNRRTTTFGSSLPSVRSSGIFLAGLEKNFVHNKNIYKKALYIRKKKFII